MESRPEKLEFLSERDGGDDDDDDGGGGGKQPSTSARGRLVPHRPSSYPRTGVRNRVGEAPRRPVLVVGRSDRGRDEGEMHIKHAADCCCC